MRRLLAVLMMPGLVTAMDQPDPMPGLPPEPRPLQLQVVTPSHDKAGTPVDAQGLADDIAALKKAVARVRQTLEPGDGGKTAPTHGTAAAGHEAEHATASEPGAPAKAEGPRKPSVRFGERLTMQRLVGGGALVSVALEREPLETIYQELGNLVGMPVDDTQVTAGRRVVSVNLDQMPWEEALDRILGQAGVAWRAEGKGSVKTLVLVDRDRLGGGSVLERLAERALAQAAQSKDPVAGAEALWLMGQQQFVAKRPIDAMRLWSNLADRFGQRREPAVRRWVMRAIKGVGDAMMQLKQYADARSVFSNYISRITEDDDPDAPEVHLSCAEAGRREGLLHHDPLVLDQAVDVLHTMLEKFADRPSAAVEVHQARLALGELLVDASRWREAETQLKLFVKDGKGHGPPADQLASWLAECAFNLGRMDEARAINEGIYRTWRTAKGDVALPQSVYQTAALRIGQCYMREKDPRWVHALFAFLRARQDFMQTPTGPEIAIAIARCYAELNRDEDSVAVLWQLIKQDARDPRPGRVQLDQLLGELEGGLSAYPGPIRARVLFYIAQAEYRNALRDRKARAAMAESSMAHFERVLAERPSAELSVAARLGLSRSALLAGQDQRAVVMLTSLLRETTLDPRDRSVASQLLGGHYRDKGMLREAIKAFSGEAE